MKMNYFKKWVFAAALALGVSGAGARVTEGTEYFLHLDGSDLYLSAETAKAGSNSELSLNNVLSEGYAQAFVFTAAEGGYNVTVGGAFTVVRDQWYMHYKNTSEVTLTGNDAIFAVEESGNGIRLKKSRHGQVCRCRQPQRRLARLQRQDRRRRLRLRPRIEGGSLQARS